MPTARSNNGSNQIVNANLIMRRAKITCILILACVSIDVHRVDILQDEYFYYHGLPICFVLVHGKICGIKTKKMSYQYYIMLLYTYA